MSDTSTADTNAVLPDPNAAEGLQGGTAPADVLVNVIKKPPPDGYGPN